ncbi:MAG: DUF4386 domain-containing protein [Actinomycetota bacterium]
MKATRNSAKIAAIMYFVSWVGSIAGLIFYGPVLKNSNYLTEGASDKHIIIGAMLELICAFANIGTAIYVFPIVRGFRESLAIGYVALRTLEAAVIAVGVLPMLAIVSLRHGGASTANANDLSSTMVDLHNWSFILGPNLVCGVNTFVLALALYKSGLVAKFIPVLGLVGGTLTFISGSLQLFGGLEQNSAGTASLSAPVFAWEISLASYLFFKGFRASVIAKKDAEDVVTDRVLVTA